jgi:hypothetical protein
MFFRSKIIATERPCADQIPSCSIRRGLGETQDERNDFPARSFLAEHARTDHPEVLQSIHAPPVVATSPRSEASRSHPMAYSHRQAPQNQTDLSARATRHLARRYDSANCSVVLRPSHGPLSTPRPEGVPGGHSTGRQVHLNTGSISRYSVRPAANMYQWFSHPPLVQNKGGWIVFGRRLPARAIRPDTISERICRLAVDHVVALLPDADTQDRAANTADRKVTIDVRFALILASRSIEFVERVIVDGGIRNGITVLIDHFAIERDWCCQRTLDLFNDFFSARHLISSGLRTCAHVGSCRRICNPRRRRRLPRFCSDRARLNLQWLW